MSLRKLIQAAALIKEWALETKHRGAGERMLSAMDRELYGAGLDDQGSSVLPALAELRTASYEADPSRGERKGSGREPIEQPGKLFAQ